MEDEVMERRSRRVAGVRRPAVVGAEDEGGDLEVHPAPGAEVRIRTHLPQRVGRGVHRRFVALVRLGAAVALLLLGLLVVPPPADPGRR